MSLSSGAYRAVTVVAIVACLVVMVGMAIAVPAFLRFLRAGGWPLIRRHVVRALIATVVGISALTALVGLAHTLTPAQRDGELVSHPAVWYYQVAFIATMLLLAVAMVVMTVATAVWWGSIASSTPWFLQGTPAGSAGSPLNVQLVGTMVLMLVASILAGYGVSRGAQSGLTFNSG